ncbi:MAG TPA: hypothetical protein VGN32_16590 [Ktedonobacterales bacterium]|jgi:hypothetical protein|nr:hypothetical protein [Ktedonobacterales bacterium]
MAAETHTTSASNDSASATPPKAAGIGTAVAFDWGLSAEFLTLAVLDVLGHRATGGQLAPVVVVLALLLGAGACFALGEALRRGNRLAWIAQVAINSVLLPGGLLLLPGTFADLGQHHFGGIIPNAILLFVDPVLVWLLTRSRTRAWVRTTTAAEAAARHGGRWLAITLPYAVILGVLVALSAYY